MEMDNRIFCLNTENKIMICFILKSNKLTVPEIVYRINDEFNVKSNRETIYRAIESLKRCGIVEKEYNLNENKICYYLVFSNIEIDFIKRKIVCLQNWMK